MRRILFDGTHLSRNASGIGTYIVELLRHLAELPTDLLFKVVVHESGRPQLEDIELGPHFALEWVPEARFPGNANFRRFLHSNRLGLAERDAVVFHASQFEVDLTSSPQIVTVHDLIPLDHHTGIGQQAFFHWVLPRALAGVSRIVAPSQATADDLCCRYHVPAASVAVIPHGVRRFTVPDLVAQTEAPPYILFAGRLTAYRNLPRLVQAFQLIEDRIPHDLLIVGEAEAGHEIRSTSARVRRLGHVTDDELARLYHGASAFAFPSLAEGFGFPPLEAIACGAPAVVSDTRSLREVCGHAAYFVDPDSVDSIAEGLLRVLSDAPLRERLRSSGLSRSAELSWRRSAESHLQLFEEAAKETIPRGDRLMHVAIDLTPLRPRPTGVDVFMLELVRHLAKVDAENRYTLFVNVEDVSRLRAIVGDNMRLLPCCTRSRASRLIFLLLLLPLFARFGSYDVYHWPSFLMPLWGMRGRHILTVHDLTFFSMPGVHIPLRRSRLFTSWIRAGIRRAELVNVPSLSVREELLRLVPEVDPERVPVTLYGIASDFTPAPASELAPHLERLGLPTPYILTVSTVDPRKNLATTLAAFERLRSDGKHDLHLVIAGGEGWGASELYRKSEAPPLRGRVHFLGYVPDQDLRWIYRGARVFVFPSLAEGFGFPPLEAAACGVPVIAARNSSLAENLQGAAELVQATDVSAWADAIQRLLPDSRHRDELIGRGSERAAEYRWDRTARDIMDCYRRLPLPKSALERREIFSST